MPHLHLATTALVILISAVLLVLFRKHRRHHLRCVSLCRRIADELSRKQEQELVIDRVFKVVIEHTSATIAILLLRENEGERLQVLRVHGLPNKVLEPGSFLKAGEQGFGFGSLSVSGGLELHRKGLREAVSNCAGAKLDARQNMMCLPIQSPQGTDGLLQLVSSCGQPYSKEQLNDLKGLGMYLDAAIQNAVKMETIQRQRDAAEALYNIGLTISRFLDIDEILRHAVEETWRLFQSDFTWYLECSDHGRLQGIVKNISGDISEDFDIGTTIPLGGRSLGLMAKTDSSQESPYILINNLAANEGEGPPGSAQPGESELFCDSHMHTAFLKLQVGSAIIVPVGNGESFQGFLCSFSRKINFYDKFQVRLQMRIANKVLIALNTADYHTQAKDLALAKERERMSNDLHDNMAQIINGLSLELHSFTRLTRREGSKDALLERLETIRPRLEEAKANIRETIFELRIPEDSDLWKNLRNFAGRFEQWHEFKVHTDLPADELRIPVSRQHEVLRIMQESLWNAHKYSGSKEAWLNGSCDEDGNIHMQIQDKGQGFEQNELHSGQGIATMQNRVSSLNGKLDITSGDQGGVCVSVMFPAHTT